MSVAQRMDNGAYLAALAERTTFRRTASG